MQKKNYSLLLSLICHSNSYFLPLPRNVLRSRKYHWANFHFRTYKVYTMNDGEKYMQVSQTYPVIKSILEEFEDEVGKMKGKCIDIGCGPGNISRSLILPNLPPDSTLVGIDISKNMIDYARKLNADEKRTIFKVMDIETTDLQTQDIENYDNALSFFCLHWVQDMRRGYRNIFKLLRPGGSMIALIIVDGSMFFAYPKLAQNPRYKEYMKDYLKYLTPLHYEEKPRESLKKMCQEIGFEVVHCSLRSIPLIFKNEENLMTLLLAVNPFSHRMPESIKDEFMCDLVQETLKQGSIYKKVPQNISGDRSLYDMYKCIVIHLKKPAM